MATSTRLLRLLALLAGRPAWTGPELAARLEVTGRTLRRDVARLREVGYPISAESGPAGGYRLRRGSILPPLPLDDDEAVAVAVALRSAAGGGVAGLEDAGLTALAKLQQVLPDRLAVQVGAVGDATMRMPGATGEPIDPDVLIVLAHACRQLTAVRLDYTTGHGTAGIREVEPFRIVHTGRRWYLVAYETQRRAWRTLRVDRIAAAQGTGRQFQRVDAPDPLELVAYGSSIGPYPLFARVRLDVGAAEASAVIPRTVGRLAVDPDASGSNPSCVLEVGGSSASWIVGHLANLPFGWEVLEPAEVREAAIELGRRIADRHVRRLNGLGWPALPT